jgi:hypothetical protein
MMHKMLQTRPPLTLFSHNPTTPFKEYYSIVTVCSTTFNSLSEVLLGYQKKKKGILSKCKLCFTIFIGVNTASLTTGENTMHVLSNYSGCHQRKTSYISNKLRNKQHGLVLRQSLYRAPQGPLISKLNGGLVEHPWSILP